MTEATAAAPQTTAPLRRAGRCPAAVMLFVATTTVMLSIDLATKYYAFAHVADEPVVNVHEAAGTDEQEAMFWRQYPQDELGVVVIPKVLSLKLTTNQGAVFGMGKGNRWLFVAASAVALIVIGWVFVFSDARARWLHLALGLVLAGALGNLYDRLVYGVVRDMLHLFPGSDIYPWIFNVADVALVIGVGLLMVLMLFGDKAEKNRHEDAKARRHEGL